jgi:hypothetical protein
MRAFNPLLAVVFGPYLGVIKLRLLLMLVPLALAQDISAQWNSIGDSIVLPVFMLDGTYSPGVSAVDVDGDGWEDLTFGNDLHGIDLYLKAEVGFEPVQVDLGLQPGDCTPRSVVWVDIDNDADQDLFLTCRIGYNRVYRNLGELVMQEITDSCGIVVNLAQKAYGLSVADINLDGHLDVFIANYASTAPLAANEFYLGDGQGHFTETEWGLAQDLFTPSHQGQFIDLNEDDRLDLYVINDKDFLNEYYIGTDSGFVDMSAETGLDVNTDAMGTAWIDEDLDGRREVYITGLDEAFFMKDTGNLSFVNVAPEYGFPPEPTTGWAVVGADFDNDGWEDLFVNSADFIHYQYPLPSWYTSQPNKWFHNDGGAGWMDRSAELPTDAQFAEIYVMAQADWNQDGSVDLAAMPIGTEALLLEGEPTEGHWLEVLPRGTISNRDGIGTKVIAYTTDDAGGVVKRVRQASCGEGMLQQNSRWLHFGLGNTEAIDSLEVRWPLGLQEMHYDLASNQRLLLTEGEVDVAPPCPEDFDGNGWVDVEDILVLLGDYGCAGESCTGDFDGDGLVGSWDLVLFLSAFGFDCPD